MNVKEYISSGVVESYVLGLASEAERRDFEANSALYPEIEEAKKLFELMLEEQLLQDATPVPQFLKTQIEERLKSSEPDVSSEQVQLERTPVHHIGIWRWIAAASVILLAGTVYWALNTNKKYQEQLAKTRELQELVQNSTAEVNQLQADIDKLQHPMKTAALKSEDSRTFATIYWDTASASGDVYLMVNNLPQPVSDKQYQLWALLNGQPINLGMIEVKQKRLLYRMKNVQNAEAFAISLEPKGGSPAPTQPVALSRL